MANKINVSLFLDTSEFQRAIKGVEKTVSNFGRSLSNAGKELTQSITIPLGLAGVAAVRTYAGIDKLRKGMIAMLGSTEAADTEMKNLREVAKLPGLGFEEAVKGSINLQAVGLSAQEARETLLGFGKALAVTGGGKNELDRVQVQLTQMISKNKILAEDYKVIQSLLPLMGEGMERAFGTRNIESIRNTGISAKEFVFRLSDALNTMPKVQNVTGGLANAFENFSDTLTIAATDIGRSIAESLDLENVFAKLGNAVQYVADWFTGLSPRMQKFIVIAAGVAVSIGPILFIIGKISSVSAVALSGIRALAGGLAFLTSPVGLIIAGIAALTAVILKFSDAGKSATKSFEEQYVAVDNLDTSVSPLISKYEELKRKTNLTADEQDELRKVTIKVGEAIPSAITQFDEYGKALSINAGKAREFIETQRAILKVQNAAAIEENQNALAKLQKEYDALNSTLNGSGKAFEGVVKKGDEFFQQIQKGGVNTARIELQKLSDDGVGQLYNRLGSLNERIKGTQGLIDQLSGGNIQIKKVEEQAQVITPKFKPLDIPDGDVRKLLKPLKKLETAGNQNSLRSLFVSVADSIRVEAFVKKAKQITDVSKKLQEDLGTNFKKISDAADERMMAARASLDNFNQGLTALLNEGVNNFVTGFAEGLGQLALAGGGIDAIFGNILGVIGSAMEQFGKLVISAGIAALNLKIALKSFGSAAGAIVAGIALVALSKVVQAKASSIKLAKGGLAFGPTLATVGDNPNAANDPEVIAPLSKLNKIIGGQKPQELILSGAFTANGQDLLLVLDRAKINRSRVR